MGLVDSSFIHCGAVGTCGGGGVNLGMYEELPNCQFLTQSVFLHRISGIPCGRGFGGNKLTAVIQKPSLERAGSFTIGEKKLQSFT